MFNLPNKFVLNIWLCQKFFVPFIPQGNSGTRIFIKMLQINLHIPKILRTFASAYKERNMCVPFDCFFHNVYTTAWSLVRAAMPIFVSYRLIDSIKTGASIGNPPKESSYPYSRLDLLPKQIIFNILFKIFGYVKNSLYLCS